LAFRGVDALIHYVINEVQKVYIPEGAAINDKHIEIIVKQMLSRVAVKDAGDTDFMTGEIVEKPKFITVNRVARKSKKQPARAVQRVFGVTRVALTTESFLSASSFQETARVLVDASVQRKTDVLRGLKENVIIGKLIPVGTGLRGVNQERLAELKAKLTPAPNGGQSTGEPPSVSGQG
jgi:DNA-directed RNA polymerase subunit beta'